MDQEAPTGFDQLATSARRLSQTAVSLAHTRLELAAVELQEERDRVIRALLLALGCAVFALLAGITLTAGVLVVLWDHSPGLAALLLTALHASAALVLYQRLRRLLAGWQMLSSTFDQLRKDSDALKQWLS